MYTYIASFNQSFCHPSSAAKCRSFQLNIAGSEMQGRLSINAKSKKKTSSFAALESRQIGIVFTTNLETSDPTTQVSGIRNVC